MANAGVIRVELELSDGHFTQRIVRANDTLRTLEAQVGANIRSMRRLNETQHSALEIVRDMTIAIGGARAAFATIQNVTFDWVMGIVRANAEVEQLTRLLRGMSTASTEAARDLEAASNLNYLFDAAKNAPFSVNALKDTFVKLKSIGIDPVKGGFDGLVNAVAAFGGSEDQLKRAAISIQQMAGKGVISMEELRQQLGEAVPNAVQLLADSLGMTYGNLVELISTGGLRANEALRRLFLNFELTFGGKAQQLMETFNGKLSRLQTTFTQFLLKVGQGGDPSGAGGLFAEAKLGLDELLSLLESPAAANFAKEFGSALGEAISMVRELLGVLIENRDLIVDIGQVMLIAFAINRLQAMVGWFGRLGGVLLESGKSAVILARALGQAFVGNFTHALGNMVGRLASGSDAMAALGVQTTLVTRKLYEKMLALKQAHAAQQAYNAAMVSGATTTAATAAAEAARAAATLGRLGTTMATAGGLAHGFIGIIGRFAGPVGIAAIAIYEIADALGLFNDKSEEALDRIRQGLAIENQEQADAAVKGLEELRLKREELLKQRAIRIFDIDDVNAQMRPLDDVIDGIQNSLRLVRKSIETETETALTGAKRRVMEVDGFAPDVSFETRLSTLLQQGNDRAKAYQRTVDRIAAMNERQVGLERDLTAAYDARAKKLQELNDTEILTIKLADGRTVAADKRVREINEELAAIDADIAKFSAAIPEQTTAMLVQQAEEAARVKIQGVRAQFETLRADFVNEQAQLRRLADGTDLKPGEHKINTEEYQKRYKESAQKLADGIVKVYEEQRKRIGDELAAITGRTDEESKKQAIILSKVIEGLDKEIANAKRVANDVTGLTIFDPKSIDPEQALERARKMMDAFSVKLAGIEGELNDTGSAYEKVLQLIANGKFETVPPEELQKLKDYARSVDDASKTLKAHRQVVDEAARAYEGFMRSLDSVSLELSALQSQLANFGVSDLTAAKDIAQKKVDAEIEAQRKLAETTAQGSVERAKLQEMEASKSLAVQQLYEKELLSGNLRYVQQERQNLLNSAANREEYTALVKKFAAADRAQLEERRRETDRVFKENGMSAEAYAKSVEGIDAAIKATYATERNADAGIGGGSYLNQGKKAAEQYRDALIALQAKSAQLREEMAGTGEGMVAKYATMIEAGTLGNLSAQQRETLLAEAAAVDALNDQFEIYRQKVQDAASAYKKLRDEVNSTRDAADLATMRLLRPNMTDSQAQIAEYAAGLDREIQKLRDRAATAVGPLLDTLNTRIAESLANREQAVANKTREVYVNLATELRKSNDQETIDLADTLGEERSLRQAQFEQNMAMLDAELQARIASNDATAAEMEQLYRRIDLVRRRFERENETGVQRLAREWADSARQMDAATTSWMQKGTDALLEFVKTGKLSFKDLTNSILEDLARIAIQKAVVGPLSSAMDGIFSSIGTAIFGGVTGASTGLDAGTAIGGPVMTAHTGARIGYDAMTPHDTATSIFTGADRYHDGGLVKGEVPIIAREGEYVFTPEQMKVVGNTVKAVPDALRMMVGLTQRMASQYDNAFASYQATMSRTSFGMLDDASGLTAAYRQMAMRDARLDADPIRGGVASINALTATIARMGNVGDTATSAVGTQSSAVGNITFNLVNETGQPMQARQQGGPRVDIRGMVLDVVLSAARQPGPFRDGMRGALG